MAADTDTRAAAPPPTWRERVTNPYVLMILAAAIFGANYVMGRAVYGEVPPYILGFVRWAGAAMLLLPFTWGKVRGDWPRVRENYRLLILSGLLMPFMGAGLTYVALTRTIVVNAGIVQTSLPIFIALLAWIFLRDRMSGMQMGGAVVAISGVLTIVARGDLGRLLGLSFNEGDMILVVCNLSLAGYSIAVRSIPRVLHPMTLLTVVCVVGAFCHAPFALAELVRGETVQPTLIAAAGLLFVAIFPSVLAIMFWNDAIARIGPSRSGVYMYLTPVFAALGAWLFLDETVELYHWIGCALIVAGVTVASRQKKT